MSVYEQQTFRHACNLHRYERTTVARGKYTSYLKDELKTKKWFKTINLRKPCTRINVVIFSKPTAEIKQYAVQRNSILHDVFLSTSLNDGFEKSKAAFEKFVKNEADNPKYYGKYIVFVDGNKYDVGDTEIELIKKVYQNIGNTDMYVGRISQEIPIRSIKSPKQY